MSEPTPSPLLVAVNAYTRRARARLGADQVGEGVRLLKELNRRLAGRNLLAAPLDELKAVGARVVAEAGGGDRGRFLTAELRAFFDAALEEGLIVRHPLTGAVRLPDPEGVAAAADMPREDGAVEAVKLVANLLEEAVQASVIVSPLALTVADLGEGGHPLVELLERLAGRWSSLTGSLHWLLEVVKVVVPLGALVLGLGAFLEGGGPFLGGGAMSTGNAMQELKVAVALLGEREIPGEGGAEPSSLQQLGDLVGTGFMAAPKVFDLERAVVRPPILYLRHRETGALVVVTPEHRGALRDGRWRMLQ
jgi:hypothetical protein